MIYWHVEEVELILTSWHQCCDTFIPSDDPLDIDTFSEEFDLRMRSHHQIQNYLSWTIVFRFGRGPSSTCSTIPRPTFSTSSTSNPPAQPSLQRPGSAAPHLQVSPEDQIHVQIMIMIISMIRSWSWSDPWSPTSCQIFPQMIHGPPQAIRSSDLIDGRRSDLVSDGLMRNHFDPMSQSQISESNTGHLRQSPLHLKSIYYTGCPKKNGA